MCMHCSIRCDKCKPAEMKGFMCPTCGKPALLSREDCLYAMGYFKMPKLPDGSENERARIRYACKHCGTDLSSTVTESITPQPCLYSNIICGYPCGKRHRSRSAKAEVCRKQVFAGKLPEAN